MRVHKGTNWTTFSAACGNDALTVYLRRIFHPTRGEEAQVEVVVEKRAKTRTVTTRATANMTPAEAKEFCTVLLGRFQTPVPEASYGNMLNTVVNAYQPIEYAGKLNDREARLVRVAFLDGYDYRASLPPDTPGTKP